MMSKSVALMWHFASIIFIVFFSCFASVNCALVPDFTFFQHPTNVKFMEGCFLCKERVSTQNVTGSIYDLFTNQFTKLLVIINLSRYLRLAVFTHGLQYFILRKLIRQKKIHQKFQVTLLPF